MAWSDATQSLGLYSTILDQDAFTQLTTVSTPLSRGGRPTTGSGVGLGDVILGAYVWIIFSLGLVGNLLVIAFGISGRGRAQRIQKLFTCSLAVADLALTLGGTWVQAQLLLAGRWVFGDTWCKVYTYVTSVSSHASIYTMMVLSVER